MTGNLDELEGYMGRTFGKQTLMDLAKLGDDIAASEKIVRAL